MVEVKFVPYAGYLMGLCADKDHMVFRWKGPGKVLFSVTQIDEAVSCHFASDKIGLRHLKKACDDFVNFCFYLFPWCKMVIACVAVSSVGRMIQKIGFVPFAKADDAIFYMKAKNEQSN